MIYTIGHSTRSIKQFIDVLKYYKIKYVVDVRRWPTSTRNPQYNRGALKESLEKEKIKYIWFGESMGGYRKFSEEKRLCHKGGKCLKSGGFKAYVYHMETEEFKKALEELIKISKKSTTAIMCAEKIYFKCHRLLISDKLKSLGIEVTHILDKDCVLPHEYSHCAKIKDGKLIISKKFAQNNW